MAESSELQQLMDEHFAAPWPDSVERGAEYRGVDAVMVDANIFGWATRAGSLTREEILELSQSCNHLDAAIPWIPLRAQPSFERLVQIARLTAANSRGVAEPDVAGWIRARAAPERRTASARQQRAAIWANANVRANNRDAAADRVPAWNFLRSSSTSACLW
ncbi:hypothetical protein [Microbacterium sp.]|uniref:hypothetical protein n=1 Tax=Microbacterium sp. TaxID=51671 RepID=UPI003F6EDAF9